MRGNGPILQEFRAKVWPLPRTVVKNYACVIEVFIRPEHRDSASSRDNALPLFMRAWAPNKNMPPKVFRRNL